MKNQEDSLFARIILIVFFLALALGGYLFSGSKFTSLITSIGPLNVMNLSGTFRTYMIIQFIALVLSLILFFKLCIDLFPRKRVGSVTNKESLWSFVRRCLGFLSIGGAILHISWFFLCFFRHFSNLFGKNPEEYLSSRKSQREEENHLPKEPLFNRVGKFVSLAKGEYKNSLQRSSTPFLKGMLSLLYWALLSLLLVAMIRWQAGSDGCEYCWKGDTQVQKETEAKIIGYPIRRYVEIPGKAEFEYLNEMTQRVKISLGQVRYHENPDEMNRLSEQYEASKTCWRRFVLGLLLFYAVFLRVILAGCYWLVYILSPRRPSAGFDRARSDLGKGKGKKPNISISDFPLNPPVSDRMPDLLLVFGCGMELSPEDLKALLKTKPAVSKFYGNVVQRGEDVSNPSDPLTDEFAEFLARDALVVSNMVVFIDLCRLPTSDFLGEIFYKILEKTPQVGKCWIVLSNGEGLRRSSADLKAVEQRVTDWKEHLTDLQNQIRKRSERFASLELVPIDWYDSQKRTLRSDAKFVSVFRSELDEYFIKDETDPSFLYAPLFNESKKIILKIFEDYRTRRENVPFDQEDRKTLLRELFRENVRAGESSLDSLYRTGTSVVQDTSEMLRLAVAVKNGIGKAFGKVERTVEQGQQVVDNVVKAARDDMVLIPKTVSHLVNTLFPKRKDSRSKIDTADRTDRYNAYRKLATRLTEYALVLEFQGMPVIDLTNRVGKMMAFFSSASALFEREDLEQVLSQIAEKISRTEREGELSAS